MMEINALQLEQAIECVAGLSQGLDPVTGEEAGNRILDHPRVIRNLNYALRMLLELRAGSFGRSRQGAYYERDVFPGAWGGAEKYAMWTGAETNAAGKNEMRSSKALDAGAGNDRWAETAAAGGRGTDGWNGAEPDDDGESTGRRTRAARKLPFPFEILKEFEYRQDQSISHLLKQFAEPAAEMNVKVPGPAAVNVRLGEAGYIKKQPDEETGQKNWVPTEKGAAIGLYTRTGSYRGRKIVSVMYNENAQRFLAENLEMLMTETDGMCDEQNEAAGNTGAEPDAVSGHESAEKNEAVGHAGAEPAIVSKHGSAEMTGISGNENPEQNGAAGWV